MHASDRVVLAGSGFGVWLDGKHLASARWMDVVRVRAITGDAHSADPLMISLQLRNGTEILVHGHVPGFAEFLLAAERRLIGMLQRSAWLAATHSAPSETVVFERN